MLLKKIELKNSEVTGSAIGHSVILEDSYVHGMVISKHGPVALKNSSAFIIHSQGEISLANSNLVYPFAYSKTGTIKIDGTVNMLDEQNENSSIKQGDVYQTEKDAFAENYWRTRDVSCHENNQANTKNEYVKKRWATRAQQTI